LIPLAVSDPSFSPEPTATATAAVAVGSGLNEQTVSAGSCNRDIKPGNVSLEASPARKSGEVRVKLLDFGLARVQDNTTHLTQSGAIVGTPAYMAPEQARGGKIDGRADLFSLGCVLYLMLTGQRPFKGNDTIALLMALAMENPPTPQRLNRDVPAAVGELTMRLLAKEAVDRPADAQAVADTVRALEAGDATAQLVKPKMKSARLPSPAGTGAGGKDASRSPRRRAPILVGIVAVALLLLGGGYRLYQVVIIRDKDGNKIAEIKVPKDGQVEIVPDGKQVDPKQAAADAAWWKEVAALPPAK
jgi:Protein kinase domain